MAGKSLEEIWSKIQKDAQDRRMNEQSEFDRINATRELQRKEWEKRMRMYESFSSNSQTVGAGGGGGNTYLEWINGYVVPGRDTAWIYPQFDIDAAVINMTSSTLLGPSIGFTYSEVSFTKIDDLNYSFPTLDDVINFYVEMFAQSSVSQPIGNVGYSLGMGTILRSYDTDRLVFRLDSGLVILEFLLMTQITRQDDLPAGGDSIDGTVGWAPVYLDWNADGIEDLPNDAIPNTYVDPLRLKLNQ
jgi:hypothetical protein